MAGTAYFYNQAALEVLDYWWSNQTIEVALLMTSTTADTENDAIAALADFTTLDEHDGSGYVRKTLSSKLTTKDDANDRAWADAADLTWTSLGAGTRDVDGVLLLWDDAGTDRPLSYHKYATPRTADGSNFTVEFRADTGLWILRQG